MERSWVGLTVWLVLLGTPDVGTRAADAAAAARTVDFNGDRRIDLRDFRQMASSWRSTGPLGDVAPPGADGVVNFLDLSLLAGCWLQEIPEPICLTWIGHASVRIAQGDRVIYVDPRKVTGTPHDADVVLVTHSHSDHYSPSDIAKVARPGTWFLGPADVVRAYGSGQVLLPGQTIEVEGLPVTGVAAYNLTKTNHPKANNWLGFVIQLGVRRIYVAGDTDLTAEMKALKGIDVAFLPAGGTYTFDAAGAAEATRYLQPQLAIPYHWGEIVGALADAQRFARLADCNVKVMAAGEVLCSDDWQTDFSMVAHWTLDETQGPIAADSAGAGDGVLAGGPVWRPAAGRVGGALEFDGVDDCVHTPFVLNPAEGPFSAFAWVRGGTPGQVILSQANAGDWLLADPATGALMTQLPQTGRSSRALLSARIVTDGQWHHVGLVWDGASRVLVVDGAEAARDTSTAPASAVGGLCLGAGAGLDAGRFWTGLIDEVYVHCRAVRSWQSVGSDAVALSRDAAGSRFSVPDSGPPLAVAGLLSRAGD